MVLLIYVHTKRRLLCEKTLYVCSFLEIRCFCETSDFCFCRVLMVHVEKLCSWDDTTVWQPYIAKYP